ncbi:MAG: beta-propeller fold lactonase family protein [Oscillospiraceae bacterium]
MGAAIRLHPSGRWLYVSVRGADVLVCFRIGEDGCLTEQSRISSGGMIPRDFDLTPDGAVSSGGKSGQRQPVRL